MEDRGGLFKPARVPTKLSPKNTQWAFASFQVDNLSHPYRFAMQSNIDCTQLKKQQCALEICPLLTLWFILSWVQFREITYTCLPIVNFWYPWMILTSARASHITRKGWWAYMVRFEFVKLCAFHLSVTHVVETNEPKDSLQRELWVCVGNSPPKSDESVANQADYSMAS